MKKKLLLIIPIIIIAILLIIIGLSINNINLEKKKENKEASLKEENNTYDVEVYSTTYLNDLIKENVDDNQLINTDILGKYTYTYKIGDEKKSIIVNVVDKTPPTVMLGNKYYHLIGTNFTILDDTFCGDNYDDRPKCYVDGDIDTEKLGTYKAKYIAIDSSGNKYEKDFEVEVVEKSKPDNEQISLEEIKKRVGNNKLLIDVSKWQDDIDWKKVKEAGIDYAFMRLGTEKFSTNELLIDTFFEKNYKEAKENNIKIGVYFYTYAKTVEDAERHANFVVENLKGKEIDLGVAYDWECWELYNGMNISIHKLNEIKDRFMEVIKSNNYRPLLYSSKNYLEKVWTINTDVWLAHYTENTNYSGDKIIWQFASNGKIPGIKNNTDVNVYYIDNEK